VMDVYTGGVFATPAPSSGQPPAREEP
jgi:hypothetical protein